MTTTEKPKRLYFIDNLRLLFILGLILLHSAKPYLGIYSIYTTPWFFFDTSSYISTVIYFFGWIDSFSDRFFLIAWYFAAHSLQKYSLKDFIKERSKRLLLPFFIAFPIVIPISYYIVFLGKEKQGLSFAFQFFFPWYEFNISNPHFIDFFQASLSTFHIDSLHLWFLPVLFTISVIAWIIYTISKRYLKTSFLDYFSKLSFLKFMGIIFITWIVTIFVSFEYLPTSRTTVGWFSVPLRHIPMYVSFFLFGMMAYKYQYISLISAKVSRYFLSIASILFLVFLWFFIFHPLTVGVQGFQNYQIQILFSFFGIFFTYFTTMGIVGLFYLYLNNYSILDSKYIRYFITAYITHFPLVLFGQYILLGRDISGAIKFWLVSIFTICMTALIIYVLQLGKEVYFSLSWK